MEREKLVFMIKSVQNGDENAMTEMYNAFYQDIYYYIFKTVHDSELSADLTQDTFIEILQSIGSLKEPAAFVTWSRQIAYRRCTAYFKKRRDILVDEEEDGYSVFDTLAEDNSEFIPDEALDKEDLKNTILGLINELPEEQRTAIMMRYFDEIPVSDIARIQGVSEGTVKSRLNYGRKAIKQSVEDYEKKHDIKLHCAGVIPLLLWLMRENRLGQGLSLTTGAATEAGAAGVIAGVNSVNAATAATASSTAVGAAVAKTVGVGIIAKIAAGVIAASIAIGGIAVGVAQLIKGNNGKTGCEHEWFFLGSNLSECSLCGLSCDHDGLMEDLPPYESEGLIYSPVKCSKCGSGYSELSLAQTDDPIRITNSFSIHDYLTEASHEYLKNLLIETWKLPNDSSVKVTPISVIYFYNTEWVEDSANNNRLIVIYHIDDGSVPGGRYTYLGRNNNVVIKRFKNDDGSYYYSVVEEGSYTDGTLSFMWIEGIKEYYSFWIDTEYPVSFLYEDVRYMGHRTVESCLKSLKINAFGEWDFKFEGFTHALLNTDHSGGFEYLNEMIVSEK